MQSSPSIVVDLIDLSSVLNEYLSKKLAEKRRAHQNSPVQFLSFRMSVPSVGASFPSNRRRSLLLRDLEESSRKTVRAAA